MKPTEYLKSVGIDISKTGNYKLKSGGFMDLTVEIWHADNGKTQVVSMCHYGEQNGDLMKDPDILFHVRNGEIKYREYQNDYAGFYSLKGPPGSRASDRPARTPLPADRAP